MQCVVCIKINILDSKIAWDIPLVVADSFQFQIMPSIAPLVVAAEHEAKKNGYIL